jgi:hypothetical protein
MTGTPVNTIFPLPRFLQGLENKWITESWGRGYLQLWVKNGMLGSLGSTSRFCTIQRYLLLSTQWHPPVLKCPNNSPGSHWHMGSFYSWGRRGCMAWGDHRPRLWLSTEDSCCGVVVCLVFLSQGTLPTLASNLLCSPGWSWTHNPPASVNPKC